MDLITTNSVAVFSLGTLFGASSVYWFLRFMKFPAKPQKVPVEERFEVVLIPISVSKTSQQSHFFISLMTRKTSTDS